MKKAIFTYFKSWRNANALLLGLAILITGFTPVSPPVVDLVTHSTAVDAAALGDNYLLSKTSITASFADVPSTTFMAPNQPVGFVANSSTVSSVFIAVGPNNVGTNNIVYRLFYSPTASAPANPLTATQHTFGSIPGDGNGTAAFGFSISGLTAATGYTFWLYQYNTVDMLYSIPAVVTRSTLSPPAAPTTNAPDPTCPAANVVSVYGDFYSPNIATNYNPNWGQSGFGSVNPNYNPGTGNVILAYPNFNYQGTELTQTNLSGMTFINFDVWTDANPSTTTLQVSPINQGTGPAEILVTVPYVRGQWTRISLPKSAFGGMTWDAVFQLKFAANGPGSTVPVDIYLDNIYFSTCGITPPPPPPVAPNQPVGFVAMNPSSSSAFLAAGPNNVGANNIVYRLYYSPTATAPANPLNATQHTFGSIPGDGNGVSPFGFNIAGLSAATQYTFWLYQYNTATMLFSPPAVATITTLTPAAVPTTNAPDPTCPASNVVSIYGDFYSPNIATNYNPNWGQSGFALTNPNYNPGTGNVILAYRNFNYQGTELTQTNLSALEFLNFDVWTDANPSTTTLQVSPINSGTGPAEVLVTVPYVRGEWTRISLPKSAFGGMTWDGVFQMKFAANGPGSLVPVDIYLDNIFFSTTNCAGGPPPMVNCNNQTITFNGQNSIPLVANQLATTSNATLSLNPSFVTCEQVGQSVPVTVTATNASNMTATCTSTITVAGLPCGWSQNPNGVNCANGNSIAYNSGTGVWTATSTNCLYGSPYTSDATAFSQRTLCGNGSITAQVTGISGTSLGWAGVIMRESNTAGAKKAQLMTNLSNFSRREFRTTTNGAANPQQFSSQNRYWLRLVRTGNQFSMYVSPNGAVWYLVGAQTIQMNACIQMGLVATNYQQTSTVTATFDNVSFSGASTVVTPTLARAGGEESVEEPYGFEAYPNPTPGELNVNLTQYLGRTVQIELYSLTGELLRQVEIEEVQTATEQLDLSTLQSGMYLIKVKTDGLPDTTRRVVLAR